jgi:hypothetical protein
VGVLAHLVFLRATLLVGGYAHPTRTDNHQDFPIPSPVYSRGRVREGAFFKDGTALIESPLPNPPPEYRKRE